MRAKRRNRGEQRAARALAKTAGLTYQQALRKLRDDRAQQAKANATDS